MLNKAILMGRLTKDPELKYTPNNVAVCSFTLAIDRNYSKQGEQKQTDFLNIVAWRNTAEFVSKYFVKGQLVAVSGSIQTRSWDKDGVKHYATDIVADEVYFAESKRNDGGGKQESSSAPADDDGFLPVDTDDELPF